MDVILVIGAAYVAGLLLVLWDGRRSGILDFWSAAVLAIIWPFLLGGAVWAQLQRFEANPVRWIGPFDLQDVRRTALVLLASIVAATALLLAVIYLIPGETLGLRGSIAWEPGSGGYL